MAARLHGMAANCNMLMIRKVHVAHGEELVELILSQKSGFDLDLLLLAPNDIVAITEFLLLIMPIRVMLYLNCPINYA